MKGQAMKDRLVRSLMRLGIFLLRGAGWAAVGVFVGFIVSYFFRFPGRIDTFALTETLLGAVITGLSIVGAFMIVLQWSNLESKMHAFDIKVRETNEFFEDVNKKGTELSKNIDEHVDLKLKELEEGKNYLQDLLEGNRKASTEANSIMEEYKKMWIENEEKFVNRQKLFEEKQNELAAMFDEFGMRTKRGY